MAEAEADEKESIDLTPPPSAGNPKWFFFPMPRGSDFLTFLKMPLLFCGIYSIYIYMHFFFPGRYFVCKEVEFFLFWHVLELLPPSNSHLFPRFFHF